VKTTGEGGDWVKKEEDHARRVFVELGIVRKMKKEPTIVTGTRGSGSKTQGKDPTQDRCVS